MFLTKVYWKSNSIFFWLQIIKSSEQEKYIYIVYGKSIWYTGGSLSRVAQILRTQLKMRLPEPSKGYEKNLPQISEKIEK